MTFRSSEFRDSDFSSHKMAESDLSSYQLQLQQVEAALTADPENQELLKLKGDLEEVRNQTFVFEELTYFNLSILLF